MLNLSPMKKNIQILIVSSFAIAGAFQLTGCSAEAPEDPGAAGAEAEEQEEAAGAEETEGTG